MTVWRRPSRLETIVAGGAASTPSVELIEPSPFWS
jgi:hypothetical protein